MQIPATAHSLPRASELSLHELRLSVWVLSIQYWCGSKYRAISLILQFEQHFCTFIIPRFGLHVEYIHMMRKILGYLPLQMTNLPRARTTFHSLLQTRCTGAWTFISAVFQREQFACCVVMVKFWILHRFVEIHRQKCLNHLSDDWRTQSHIELTFIVLLSKYVVPIISVSQLQQETC
jgi:hypothetical protein